MFEITIKETKTVTKLVGNNWGIIGTKEVERETRHYQTDANEPKTRIEEVRGYLPAKEQDVEVTTEVLKQSVETLDLAAVIKAINSL